MYTAIVFVTALLVGFIAIHTIAPGLKRKGHTGVDVNKLEKPEIPEMGGIAIVLGFGGGILLFIGLQTFVGVFKGIDPVPVLMALLTTFLVATLGMLDDLIEVNQVVKAITPLFAAVPLMMVKAGKTTLGIPFLPVNVNFGIIYPLVLIPIGMSGAANVVNMLAGFNGLEVGMGIVAMGSLGVIAYILEAGASQVILAAGIGSLIATLYFNWYPAKILIGDIGTFSIGAIIASSVIIGNFELAGVVVILPYAVDFVIKAVNGFPTENWWGELKGDKLHCPEGPPRGLAQLIMKLTGGITERALVITLMGLEAVCGLLAIIFYL